ncbi:hypothetical protein SAICODRAFT_30588 [Saitoella complicata NRRL Y-17804]|nr:uncharacterized protein SAICODRAFT_30588 [Saitoella complicata NRRL Y-17804]ODQ52812.1 hypothetical protein SAICODRAFT_30588 [Saitoella complicata NRRL Y-17804]
MLPRRITASVCKNKSIFFAAPSRTFTSSRPAFAEEAETSAEDTAVEKEATQAKPRGPVKNRLRAAFFRWEETKGLALKYPSGPTYINQARVPFPSNPTFRPRPVLSRAEKDSIYEAWQNGKSILELSQQRSLSLERVKAVVRLVDFERKMIDSNQHTLFTFEREVHRYLPHLTNTTEPEDAVTIMSPTKAGYARMTMVPESRSITSEDAAEVMKIKTMNELEQEALAKADEMERIERMRVEGIVQRKAYEGVRKGTFRIVDTSAPKEPKESMSA